MGLFFCFVAASRRADDGKAATMQDNVAEFNLTYGFVSQTTGISMRSMHRLIIVNTPPLWNR
jgi:hypothetical protein